MPFKYYLGRTPQLQHSPPKNIVVFGESGIGKGSLINTIIDCPAAVIASDATGCTTKHKKYDVEIHGKRYAIWDTAGLDEGPHGKVPAKIAAKNLKKLLRRLIRANRIDLLILCTRGSRVRKALQNNYNLFYSAICQKKKVPIALVVTGLENCDEEMEKWWITNEAELTKLEMNFDGHACVTTLKAKECDSPVLKQRCFESRQTILSMIANTCSRGHVATGRQSWLASAFGNVGAIASPRRRSNPPPAPNVVVYDASEISQVQTGSPEDKPTFEGRLMCIQGSPLNVYRISDQLLLAGNRFRKHISHRGADFLVFCVSTRPDIQGFQQILGSFYGSYGGESKPLLIVVKGAETDEAARCWWGGCSDVPQAQAIVSALPLPGSAQARIAVEQLQEVIQTHLLQPAEGAGCFEWLFGRKHPSKLRSGDTHTPIEEDALTKSKVWVPWSFN